MIKFFDPGISLLNKLKYPQKFLLVTILFLFLILGLTLFLFSNFEKRIQLSKSKIIGLEYINSMVNLLHDLQQHRGHTSIYLAGDKSSKKVILIERQQVINDINTVDNLDKTYGKELQTTKEWKLIKKQWDTIKNKGVSLTPEENLKLHIYIITSILSLINHIGDTSNLILSSTLNTCYLSNCVVNRFPLLIEEMGESRSYSIYYLSKGEINNFEQDNILIIITNIKLYQHFLNTDMNKIFLTNKSKNSALYRSFQKFNPEINELLNLLNAELKNKYNNPKINLKNFYTSASKPIDQVFNFYELTISTLQSDLQNQIHKFNNLKLLIIIISSLLFLSVSYLFISFYISIIKTITDFKNASEVIANGDFSKRITLETKDELAVLGASLNKIAESLADFVERETLLKQIMLSSISSLDIKNVLSTIVVQTGKFFKADRCLFLEFNEQTQEYSPIKDYEVYTSSPKIDKMINVKISNELIEPLIRGSISEKKALAINKIENLGLPENTILFLQQYEIKSALLAPMFYGNSHIGLLFINYIDNYKDFNHNKISILSTVADQASIIIHQSKLYEEIQQRVFRENLLRLIINQILNSENLEESIQKIVNEVGELLKADRTSLRFFNQDLKSFSDVIGEYRRNSYIPSTKSNFDFTQELNSYIYNQIFENNKFIIIDNIDNEKYSDFLKESFKIFNVKSSIVAPIFYKEIPIAAIFITNTESFKTWDRDSIDLLKPILQQISIGINLFTLNEKLKKSISNERSLREIISKVRQFNTHNEIYNYLLKQLISIFEVDTAYHFHIDKLGNLFLKNIALKNNDTEPQISQDIICSKCFNELIPKSENLFVSNDIEKDINDINLLGFLKSINAKSFIAISTTRLKSVFPELQESEIVGVTLISSTLKRIWIPEEIDYFKLITDSVSIIYLELQQRSQLDKTKETFIATLTHDLRSPIYAEQKALEFILSRKPDSKLKDYLEFHEDMYKTNEELLRIVNNILSVYHYESGKTKLDYEEFDIHDIANQTIRKLKFLAKEKDSELITIIEENIPVIKADKEEISRVIDNLVSNAIKHTKKSTKIIINAQKKDNFIEISIADNGQGIPNSEKSKIFERYPTIKRNVGTGLGLYLSKQIIEAHKGSIWFDSQENKGTTFYIKLPLS